MARGYLSNKPGQTSGGGLPPDGTYGSIIVSNAGTIWTPGNASITLAMLGFDVATQAELDAAIAGLSTVYQPLDSDLTAIALLATTSYGRGLLTQAASGNAQTYLGLGSAATQASTAFDAAGAAAAAQAASQPVDSDLTAIALLATTSYGRNVLTLANAAAADWVAKATFPWSLIVALSDETTAIAVNAAASTFRMPFAGTLTEVRAHLNTASSSGLPTFDIKQGGASVLSTLITIDATELTSQTAATPPVISTSALTDDSAMSLAITGAGTGAKGAKIVMKGTRVV